MDQLKKILNPKIWLIIMALIHAVAGVINTVLKDDFDGLTMRVRQD